MIIFTKNMLNSRSGMKDLRFTNVIVRLKIIRTSYELILNQLHYVDNLLGKFNKDNSGIPEHQ